MTTTRPTAKIAAYAGRAHRADPAADDARDDDRRRRSPGRAPSRPTMNRARSRPTTAAGVPYAMSRGASSTDGQHQGVRRDRERPLGPARPSAGEASGSGVAAGSIAGSADRPADPEARDRRRCPTRRPGRRASVPAARAAARSAAISGSPPLVDRVRLAAEVGAGRVVQVGEGQGAPDDRDLVAGFEPRLAVGLPPSAAHAVTAGAQRPRPGTGFVDGQQLGDRLIPVDLRGPKGAPGPPVQPGRLLTEQPGLVLEAHRCLDPGAAREDPEVARRVAHREADRALLGEPVAGDVDVDRVIAGSRWRIGSRRMAASGGARRA